MATFAQKVIVVTGKPIGHAVVFEAGKFVAILTNDDTASSKHILAPVVGASSGLGAGAAVHLAGLGARLLLTGRNLERLESTVQACQQAGAGLDQVKVVTGDVREAEVVKKVVDTAVETFGGIDILVNSAGVMYFGGYESATVEDLDTMYSINVVAAFNMCKQAMPHLIKSRGSIVNVSSLAGCRPMAGYLAYSMSKAALNQMSMCLALEVASKGVRVNCVNPSAIVTPLLEIPGGPMSTPEGKEKFLKMASSLHPASRLGEVDEVSKVIAWLASDQSSFVNGVCVPIDGGRHATTWGCMPPPKPQ